MQDRGFLEIAGLNVGYGATRVLTGIDLAVRKGEFVALLGASGCGKTTLLRTIAGFASPDSGTVAVAGRDVTRLPPDRRGMALVFQSYALWPHMTVAETIGYGLKLRRTPREQIARRVAEIEAQLGLTGLSERKPAQLSGGQRQRVALGRALAIDPEMLLLDEPLSNLDARIRLSVRHEIRGLQQRLGITAIHVTHDREEAMVMADRIVILDAGRIAQAGTPEALYNRPESAFVAAFLGAENRLELAGSVEGESLVLAPGPTNLAATVPLAGRPLASGRFEARFRPEAAALVATGSDIGNRVGFPGTIETLTYPGGHWRHSVRVGETLLLADSPAPHQPGTAVTVAVAPADLFVFPLAGAAPSAPVPAPEARPAAGNVSPLTRTHQETIQ